MPVENLPLWTLPPNWQETVSEVLSWESSVLFSPSGAEQRFSLRSTPRRSFEASFLPNGVERTWVDNALSAAAASRWYVPIFHDFGRTTAAISAGSATIPVETAGREFFVGGFVMLRSSVFVASVHEITEVGPSSLTVTPNVGAYPTNTPVLPCAPMRIEGAPSLARLADRTARTRLRFESDGPSPFTPASLGTNYVGYPVLAVAPNERSDLTSDYGRILAEFSVSRARRVVVDTAGRNFSVQRHAWMVAGRAEQDALRGYFYALQGRRVATWVPTFAADFDLVASAGSGATQITVARSGFHRFGGPRFGREHIRIELRNGTTILRRITASAESGDNEILTLSASLGTAISPATVKRISFMSLCRLEQDSIEFVHYADKQGAMTTAASFRTAGEFREAPAVLPMPFFMGAATPQNCGDPLPPPPPVIVGRTHLWLSGSITDDAFLGDIPFNRTIETIPGVTVDLSGRIFAPPGVTGARVSTQTWFTRPLLRSGRFGILRIERSDEVLFTAMTESPLPSGGVLDFNFPSVSLSIGPVDFDISPPQFIKIESDQTLEPDGQADYIYAPQVDGEDFTFVIIDWLAPGPSWFPI